MRKSRTFALALGLTGLVSFSPLSTPAHAIGCLSGGAAGALAGHMAGHGILGALGGCVAGHQWHKHQVRKRNLENVQSYDAQRRTYDPNYQSPWTR